MRRLRTSDSMRRLVRGTNLSTDDLVYPLFVKPGSNITEPIPSLEGCSYYSPDTIVAEAEQIYKLGIPAVLIFGQPTKKDPEGSQAYDENAPVQQAVRNIKKQCPDLLVITDVCLCAYTDHGHCGLVDDKGNIKNDPTCQLLARTALTHAQAGADIVAPSDMMDGRVGHIRQCLDENEHENTAIMSYSAKFTSSFYGPFRDVADSAPTFGDRRSYQMDPAANHRQALSEIALDIQEGADIVMVKPALAYLDIITLARQQFRTPLAAYNVSGEYMMLKSAVRHNLIDHDQAMLETLTCIKRAGADIIITYFAKQAAKLLNK